MEQPRTTTLTVPELLTIALTRVALGAGLGLLLGERLNADQRRSVGRTLFAIGAISTLPLGFLVLRRRAVELDASDFQVGKVA